MSEISVQAADGSKQRFPIQKDRLTIGRSRENDIFLPDQWLSRHHAEVRQKGDGFYVIDLGSKNGTLLNGVRLVEEARLRPGDIVTLGEHLLTLAADEPEDDDELYGTQMFNARELSDVNTKPVDLEGLTRQNRVLSVLSNAANTLLVHRPLPELFELVLDLVFEAVPAERAAILLVEARTPLDPSLPVIKASRSRTGQPITRVSRSIARRVLEQRLSLLIPNILEDAHLRAQESIMSTGIRSALCAPLWYTSASGQHDAVIGLMYLDTQAHQPFTEDDLRLLTAIANVAAAKIENARLLEESLEKRRMEEDMRLAADIQRSLLPGAPPRLAGYALMGSNRPCRTVGGDYYDYTLVNGQLTFALGDVSGKGTSAALLMTVLRAAVRAHWGDASPAEATSRINRTVCQNVPENKYATFCLGRLDPPSGRVTYVNAGHNPPLLVRRDGRVEELTEGGMVLGMFEAAPYSEATVEMEAGDVLVVYSDGVSETFSAEAEEYGEKRLAEAILRNHDKDPEGLELAILQEIEEFSGGAKATDDRTLIVLKRD